MWYYHPCYLNYHHCISMFLLLLSFVFIILLLFLYSLVFYKTQSATKKQRRLVVVVVFVEIVKYTDCRNIFIKYSTTTKPPTTTTTVFVFHGSGSRSTYSLTNHIPNQPTNYHQQATNIKRPLTYYLTNFT